MEERKIGIKQGHKNRQAEGPMKRCNKKTAGKDKASDVKRTARTIH